MQRVAFQLEDIDSDGCEYARTRIALTAADVNALDNAELPCLVRYSWNFLDRGYDSEPALAVIYDQVEDFTVSVYGEQYDSNGELTAADWFLEWPSSQATTETINPVAIRVEIQLPSFGKIERIWPVAPGES